MCICIGIKDIAWIRESKAGSNDHGNCMHDKNGRWQIRMIKESELTTISMIYGTTMIVTKSDDIQGGYIKQYDTGTMITYSNGVTMGKDKRIERFKASLVLYVCIWLIFYFICYVQRIKELKALKHAKRTNRIVKGQIEDNTMKENIGLGETLIIMLWKKILN